MELIFYNYFVSAIIALGIASAWGIGAWLFSDFLATKKPRKKRKRQSEREAEEARHRYYVWTWSIPVVGILILMLAGVLILTRHTDQRVKAIQARLTASRDWLEPGNDPTPPNVCRDFVTPAGITLLFLGTHNVVHKINTFPHTVLLINGRHSLVLDKSADGRIAPIVDVRSPDEKIVVRMNNQEGFVVNSNNDLEFQRPDTHSLIVVDQYGREVLNARYLNPQAFKLTGIFTIPGYGSIPLEDKNLADSCFDIAPNGRQFNNDIVINIPKQP